MLSLDRGLWENMVQLKQGIVNCEMASFKPQLQIAMLLFLEITSVWYTTGLTRNQSHTGEGRGIALLFD